MARSRGVGWHWNECFGVIHLIRAALTRSL